MKVLIVAIMLSMIGCSARIRIEDDSAQAAINELNKRNAPKIYNYTGDLINDMNSRFGEKK